MNTIFIVTTLFFNFDKTDKFTGQTRESTVGWFKTKREAEDAIINNALDMFEIGYYNYAVIEEVAPGPHPRINSETWFVAEYKDGPIEPEYEPDIKKIDKPDFLRNITGFFG